MEWSSDLNSLLKSEKNAHSILNIESSLIGLLAHLSPDKYFISLLQVVVCFELPGGERFQNWKIFQST